MSFERRIKLFGEDYILIGNLKDGGPIATEEQYSNFECSFAHLKPDGNIWRFGRIIGTKDDIQVSNIAVEVEKKASMEDVFSAILNPVAWANKEINRT